MRRGRARALWLPLSATLGAGCESSRLSESASEGWPHWTLAPTVLQSVGAVDGETGYLLNRVEGVRLLPDGGVAIANSGSASIRIYDSTGVLQSELGRRGEGPGEFDYPNSLWVREPDTLLVYDSGLRRLTRFSLDDVAREPETVTFRVDEGFPEVYLGQLANGSHVLAWMALGELDASEITADPMAIGRFNSEGVLEASIASVTRNEGNPVPDPYVASLPR